MAKEKTLLPCTRRRMASRHGHPLHSREEENETWKDIFTPGGHAKLRGSHRAVLFVSVTTDRHVPAVADLWGREKQAHKLVAARVYQEERWTAKGTNGSDHVNRAKSRSDGRERSIGKTDGHRATTQQDPTVRIQMVWMNPDSHKNVSSRYARNDGRAEEEACSKALTCRRRRRAEPWYLGLDLGHGTDSKKFFFNAVQPGRVRVRDNSLYLTVINTS
jgi:hypothetical protein